MVHTIGTARATCVGEDGGRFTLELPADVLADVMAEYGFEPTSIEVGGSRLELPYALRHPSNAHLAMAIASTGGLPSDLSDAALREASLTSLLRDAYLATELLSQEPFDDELAERRARLSGEVARRASSVETPFGSLRAEPVGDDGEYVGFQVILDKPDGTSGVVSQTEFAPGYDPAERLRTFAYDGDGDEPEMVACNPSGSWGAPDAEDIGAMRAMTESGVLLESFKASRELDARDPETPFIESASRLSALMAEMSRRESGAVTPAGELFACASYRPFEKCASVDVAIEMEGGRWGFVSRTGIDITTGEVETMANDGLDVNPRTRIACNRDGMWMRDRTSRNASPSDGRLERSVPVAFDGDNALVMRKSGESTEYVVAYGYDRETGHWSHGSHHDSIASAAAELEGRAISIAKDVFLPEELEPELNRPSTKLGHGTGGQPDPAAQADSARKAAAMGSTPQAPTIEKGPIHG